MKPTTPLVSVLALALCASLSLAKSPENIDDDFSASELSSKWKAAKGKWTIENGKLKGAELPADEHAAVLTYQAPHTDSKVSFSFELAGSKGFSLSYNHTKGHLFRVNVTGNKVSVLMDKDKKDPASKQELLDSKKASFKEGKTYAMTCETKGDTVTVTFDDGHGPSLTGKHAGLAKEKTGYRLVLRGDGVLFDDFAVSK